MTRKTILTAAITGNLMTPEISPHLPVTPEQIARQALDAASAGAAIVHLHVRDPETAKGSMRLDLYEELVARIRAENSDVLLNLTTRSGGLSRLTMIHRSPRPVRPYARLKNAWPMSRLYSPIFARWISTPCGRVRRP